MGPPNRFGSGTVGDRVKGKVIVFGVLGAVGAGLAALLARAKPRSKPDDSAASPGDHRGAGATVLPNAEPTALIPLDMLKRDVGIAACLRDADGEGTRIRQRGDLTDAEKAKLATAVRAKADARRAQILDMDQAALAKMIDELRHRADFALIEASVRRSAGQGYAHVRLT